jgi:hypothetical protein
MRARCTYPKHIVYKHYGARGIKVCDRWQGVDGFANFMSDMGSRPSKQYTVERRDSDGDYCPENCYWATRAAQARNRKGLRPLTFKGETMVVKDWADRLGMDKGTLYARLARGWSVERVLETPLLVRLTRAATA